MTSPLTFCLMTLNDATVSPMTLASADTYVLAGTEAACFDW
jgi:hypothetical protein